MPTITQRKPIPKRFQVARPTLVFDRFMFHFIKLGGLGIILAVFGIFVFILFQIWPLFGGAKVEEGAVFSLGEGRQFVAMGTDEWSELPFFLEENGSLSFLDTVDVDGEANRGFFSSPTPLPGFNEGTEYSFLRYNERGGDLLVGTNDGRFSIVDISYQATFPQGGGRQIIPTVTPTPLLPIGREGAAIERLAYGDSGPRRIAAAIQSDEGRKELHAVTLVQPRTLFGVGAVRVDRNFDLTHLLATEPDDLIVSWEADSLLVAGEDGTISYLFAERDGFALRQVFTPFADLEDPRIAFMGFLLGDVSVVFTSHSGENRVFSLYRDEEEGRRIWGWTKTFPSLSGGAEFFSSGQRNKSFLLGRDNFASLRYSTTENIRWEEELPFSIAHAAIAPRYNRLLFMDTRNNYRVYELNDPHPSAGWKTYFGKIQYEGQAEATYTWQSTGGTDDFERKLSLIPLIIGTFKGTFYAMILAFPIAILAALYTSQFLRPGIKRFVKPTMEIMASLPSVVLGFLAALWLAPIVSNAVPSVVLASIGVVGGAFFVGLLWGRIPAKNRFGITPGYEFLLYFPFLLLFAWSGWKLGPIVEAMFFVVTDPDTGQRVADFRLWFPTVTGLGFEQRNAFVIGFVMGFAVIPIIFTIAEDALSHVPASFRSGSLALGASRWQTAIWVVLPTASAGIFSAVMIGLGRAVGETMIVLMAAGGTPVNDFNLFTGMRTLSANIAMELPEAPYLGTLYRTLFLGAMLLFALTFLVNTAAEIMRQRLREKYKAVE